MYFVISDESIAPEQKRKQNAPIDLVLYNGKLDASVEVVRVLQNAVPVQVVVQSGCKLYPECIWTMYVCTCISSYGQSPTERWS
jgi:hypothetical protein